MKGSRLRAESHGLEWDSSEASHGSGQVVKARSPSLTTWRALAHVARTLAIRTVGASPDKECVGGSGRSRRYVGAR
jgi:hypothetical protein